MSASQHLAHFLAQGIQWLQYLLTQLTLWLPEDPEFWAHPLVMLVVTVTTIMLSFTVYRLFWQLVWWGVYLGGVGTLGYLAYQYPEWWTLHLQKAWIWGQAHVDLMTLIGTTSALGLSVLFLLYLRHRRRSQNKITNFLKERYPGIQESEQLVPQLVQDLMRAEEEIAYLRSISQHRQVTTRELEEAIQKHQPK